MIFEFDDYRFDADIRQLSRGEERVTLRPMTASVLAFLIDNRDRYASQDELMEAVWGHKALTTSVLSRSIHEIRQALGDSAQEPRYIDTRYRVGYRFVATVRECPEGGIVAQSVDAEAPPRSDIASNPVDEKPQLRHGRAVPWLLALCLLAVTVLALFHWWSSDSADRATGAALINAPPAEPEAARWFDEGTQALAAHRVREARNWFERALQRVPGHVPTLASLGDALLQSGDRQEALDTLHSAKEKAGDLPRIDQLRIDALLAAAEYRWQDAVKHWTAVVQMNPGDAAAGIRLGDAQLIAGDVDGAADTLAQLRELPGADPLEVDLFAIRLQTTRGDHAARLREAEAAERLAKTPIKLAQARMEKGWALFGLGRLDDAEAVLDGMGSDDDLWVQAHGDLLRANIARGRGQLPVAVDAFEQAADRAEQLGDHILAATARIQRAFVQVLMADMEGARIAIDATRERAIELGSPRVEAMTYDVDTLYWQRAGDLASSLVAGEKARQLFRDTGDLLGIASTCNQLGATYARMGRWAEAENCLDESLQLFKQVGDAHGQATALSNLAPVYLRTGRSDRAREANETALSLYQQLDAFPEIARLQFNLALQDRRSGAITVASLRLREAVDAFDRMQARDSAYRAAAALTELYTMQLRPEEAATVIEAHPLDAPVNPLPGSMMLTAAAHVAMQAGRFEEAASRLREALAMRRDAGLDDWALVSELDVIELEARQGRRDGHAQRIEAIRRQFLEAKDFPAASDAGLMLLRHWLAENQQAEAEAVLAQLQPLFSVPTDALMTWRFDVLRALLRRDPDMAAQLAALADKAEAMGMRTLAAEARRLANAGDDARALLANGEDGRAPALR